MPRYSYKARQVDGTLTQGILRAANEERAANLLRAHALSPVSITLSEEVSLLDKPVFAGQPGIKELIIFSRQLSSMIRAGVPILESLQALERQVQKPLFRQSLQDMIYDIEAGESLSSAMSKQVEVFTPFVLGMVRTGEASGRLSESLASVAEYLEQDYLFVRRVRAAFTYPVFVLGLVIVLTIIMFLYVLPQLVTLFDDAGVALPLPTRILLGLTVFIQNFWPVLIALLVIGALIFRSYIKTADGKYALSSFVLSVPIINTFFQKLYLSRLTSLLKTLFSSDVPALESFELAKEAVGNRVYQRILQDTIDSIKDGASISTVWRREEYIPPMLTAMIAVGERSGEISKAFDEAGRFFRQDVESMLETVAVLIEPILLVLLGIGVGIVVAAVLLPIYNLVLVL